MKTLYIHIDGASRGNPGPAGIGVYGYYEEASGKKIVIQEAVYLGKQTNNVAEYCALIHALHCIKELHLPGSVRIATDSQLMQKQVIGAYKVKTPHIQVLFTRVFELRQEVPFFIEHVLRAYNKDADALANKGVDEKQPIPAHLQAILNSLA